MPILVFIKPKTLKWNALMKELILLWISSWKLQTISWYFTYIKKKKKLLQIIYFLFSVL